ncbi:hypothetical protein BJF78_24525 [Pseudonocardia sp. CNS-139]|nr:hypothetical protein BJF78_24525 [Pseudonocardia sp. CNS-139]
MPGVQIRAVSRLPAVAALAALLAAGCSATPVPVPMPTPSPARPGGDSCQVTATSGGSISSTGARTRTSTVNGRVSLSCSDAPVITIAGIADDGVTFSWPGGTVTIAPGTSGQADGYTIDVTSVGGGTAVFRIAPA